MKRESLILSLSLALAMGLSAFCHPAFAETKLQEGVRLYNAKQYKEAAAALDLYLNQNPKDSYAAYYAALSHQQSGNMNKARQYYRVTATVAPESQIGGYAKSILMKLDPSFAAAQAGASTGSSNGTSSSGTSSNGTSAAGKTGTASPGNAPATIDPKLPKECDVRCQKEGGSIWVNTSVNGKPIRMVFDTGAPGVCLGKNQLEELGIQPPDGAPSGQTGGSSNSSAIDYWLMNATVKVGNLERVVPVTVLEHNASCPLLGQIFFKEFDYTIDQGAGNIHFRQKALGPQGSIRNAYSMPFEFRKAGNRIVVTAEINGRPGQFIFDTGNSASAISFHSIKQAEKYGARVPDDAEVGSHGGVSGSGRVRIFIVGRVKMGPIDRANVEVSANEQGNDDELPLLGEPYWQDYQYTIDMNQKKIHFVRR